MVVMKNQRLKQKYILLFILAIAIFFRCWQLNSIPPGLYHDEAINGNEAIFDPGKIFYPENNGREGLFVNLITLSFSILGISIWSLRIVSAIIGVLTVWGLYLLTKELFSSTTSYKLQATNIAFLSSFFLAVSFWHTNLSRIGFRTILVPFILVFSFYFLVKGFRTQKTSYFITAGIFFGLGFYTYAAFRLAALLLIAVLLLWGFIYKKQNLEKKFLLFTAYYLLSIVIVVLPIGIHFLQNPQYFIGRASQVSIFSQPNILKSFGESLISHLGMFNVYGDWNWRHNVSESPQLLLPVGLLFLIGFFISIKESKNSIRKKNYLPLVIHCSLLSWFFIMLLPGILTYEGIPHALRAIGTIPVVYIFAGLGSWQAYRWLNQNIKNKSLLFLISAIFLLTVLSFQFNKYFILWGTHPEAENGFSKDYVEIGNYLNSLPYGTQKIVIINRGGVPVPWPDGIPMPAQTIMFIESTKYEKTQSLYLSLDDIDKIRINKKPTVIVPIKYEQSLFQKLRTMFPEGKTKKENNILIYEIQS